MARTKRATISQSCGVSGGAADGGPASVFLPPPPSTAPTVPDDSSAAALAPVPQTWLASSTAVTSLGKPYEQLTLHWQAAANEMRTHLVFG